jgi:polyhydroxyalkanoate synthesis regulator phasin
MEKLNIVTEKGNHSQIGMVKESRKARNELADKMQGKGWMTHKQIRELMGFEFAYPILLEMVNQGVLEREEVKHKNHRWLFRILPQGKVTVKQPSNDILKVVNDKIQEYDNQIDSLYSKIAALEDIKKDL